MITTINKKLSFAGILIMCLLSCANLLFAQDEKDIWTKCIDSIYRKEATVIFYPNEKYPVDPTIRLIDTTEKKIRIQPFVLYINTELLENSKDHYGHYKRLLNDKLQTKSLNALTFNRLGKQDSLMIEVQAYEFCY